MPAAVTTLVQMPVPICPGLTVGMLLGYAAASVQLNEESTPMLPTESPMSTPAPEVEIPDYVLNPNMSMPVKRIDGQNYIGILEIPAIKKDSGKMRLSFQ